MNLDEINEYLSISKSAALMALDSLTSYRRQILKYSFDQESPREMKADIDFIIESIILEQLKKTNLPILSEESGEHLNVNSFGLCWIVDPIDGTINYVRDLGESATSIALFLNGRPLLGIVACHKSGDLAWGGASLGSFINGQKIKVSTVSNKIQGVLCTGIPSQFQFDSHSVGQLIEKVSQFGKTRMLGSAAISLLNVAKGSAEAYWEKEIMLWDIAAGLALVEGAGGEFVMGTGSKLYACDIYASNNLFVGV